MQTPGISMSMKKYESTCKKGMLMRYPDPLKKGGTVGLIAPASPVSKEACEECRRRLEELGFSVLIGKNLKRGDEIHGYLAGSSQKRAEDVNEMFLDSRVQAIFCVRGGYGSAQILRYLDYKAIRQNPKIFVGYSDITSLHLAFLRHCNFITFHGPMVQPDLLSGAKDAKKAYIIESLQEACNGTGSFCFQNPPGEKLFPIKKGEAAGRLTGGNLSVLAKSLGTPYSPIFTDAVLFLEEVGESIPRIDMYLTQLENAGAFAQVKGILLGDFTDCTNENYNGSLKIKTFLKERFWGMELPVLGNVCSDHRWPMGTLPLGAECRIRDGKISFMR